MRKLLLPALGLVALSSLAPAQNADVKERRGYFTVGLHLPQDVDGGDFDLGLAYSVGGNLIARESYRVGLEFRGSINGASADGFDDDLTLSVNSIFARYSTRPRDGRGTFFGGGLGLGKASLSTDNVSFSDEDVRFVFDAFVGYDFSPTTFALARYQGSGEQGYRGFSVEFGYRF